MWRRRLEVDSLSNRPNGSNGTVDAEVGYGSPARGGAGTGTPWAGISMSERGRSVRLGYRLRFGDSVAVEVAGTLRTSIEDDEDPSNFALMARLLIR